MENWEEAIDLLSATGAFNLKDGGVSIDNRIIKCLDKILKEKIEIFKMLDDLVFECDGIIETRAPSRLIYNKAFRIISKYKNKKKPQDGREEG